jgi:hypothetical protein
MKATFLLAAGLFVASVSCERHDWEEVKVLHEEHHHEGHHAEGAEGEHATGEHSPEAAPEKEGH